MYTRHVNRCWQLEMENPRQVDGIGPFSNVEEKYQRVVSPQTPHEEESAIGESTDIVFSMGEGFFFAEFC